MLEKLFDKEDSMRKDEITKTEREIEKIHSRITTLGGVLQEVGWKVKKKIISCIFSKKIVMEKSKVATYEFTTPIQVLLNVSKVCRGTKKRQEVENDLLSCMAPQVGLEPTTYGLTVRRSNQLSY